jgi:hypothetical protein
LWGIDALLPSLLRCLRDGHLSALLLEEGGSALLYAEAEFKDHLQASAAGDPQQFTWRVKRADGELIWVQIHLSQQTLADQTCVCAEVRDITAFYEIHHRAELFWRVLRHNLRNEATIIAGNATRITANAETAQI